MEQKLKALENFRRLWEDNTSKVIGAYECQSKADIEYATRRGAQDMTHLLGYNRMSFKGDQEPALRVLMKNIKMLSGDQCILLDSPVGDSQSNGDAESAVKQVQGQFRTMRSDLETCYGRAIPANHHIMPFIVRHAAGTINREKIGTDGMTAHKRFRGKEFKKEIFKIGECVWFLRPKSKGKQKAEHRWLNGIWPGIR